MAVYRWESGKLEMLSWSFSYTVRAKQVDCLHLPLDKMAVISHPDVFRCIFMKEKFCILIWISLNFVPRGPTDNKPALVQVMAWRWIGDKPLSEPMLNQFIDIYMRHMGKMS